MGLARSALLWVSENRKLRQSLPKYKFIRRAVSRFMPGEQPEDAFRAATELSGKSINAILTHLGENIADENEAKGVEDHYKGILDQIKKSNLDSYISVKLTQLGLDINEELCFQNVVALVKQAQTLNNMVWIDMEQSSTVDRTLAIYKKVRKDYPNAGVCLQAYLYRTKKDLDDLLPLSPAIRLVKGAYAEPPNIAYPKKSDVDSNFFALARVLLGKAQQGVKVGIATHDKALIQSVRQEAEQLGLSRKDYEFQLLYGIQTAEQFRLVADGCQVRVLISYGTYWFPWYVRRLAERPANVWFVLRNVIST
jgi:proline dehydrogenase